ncbi:hypothetical protein BDV25DRAFT_167714 [Aspergillus avenaceus]|uniref:Uncharacterized protein n=1 Tax=Aspergillus avenaceus TaxID=36643 RepID=A0A5N6U9G2_ASPAV|nr:hypothetical protein BDV25DRAFT_167714 [Aspergillus avenaceus]
MSGSVETFAKPSNFFMRHASRTNTRIPPIAHRSSSPLPCRMAVLSRDKLHKETSAKNPDLRRCLGHQRLLRHSIEVAQEDMRKTMASFKLEDSDDEDDIPGRDFNSPSPMIREQITKAVKAMVKRRAATPAHKSDFLSEQPQLVRVSSKNDSSPNVTSKFDRYYNHPPVATRRRKNTTKSSISRRLWPSSGPSVAAMAS